MASKYAHELKTRGFDILTHGPVPSMIRQKFAEVSLGEDQSIPVYCHGILYTLPITFVLDETGKAWVEDGHVPLDGLGFKRITLPEPK